jgi:hypothetical protein
MPSPVVLVRLHFQLDWGMQKKATQQLSTCVEPFARLCFGWHIHPPSLCKRHHNLPHPLLLSHRNEIATRKISCGMQTAEAREAKEGGEGQP